MHAFGECATPMKPLIFPRFAFGSAYGVGLRFGELTALGCSFLQSYKEACQCVTSEAVQV